MYVACLAPAPLIMCPLTLIILFFHCSFAARVLKSYKTLINSQVGPIEGSNEFVLDQTITSFLGVPFAKPPIGSRRFLAPEPVEKWSHTFKATKLSKACFQETDGTFGSFWGSSMWNANTNISEDCLHLNMWVPKNGRNLPVMVWLFGGGFWYGSPSLTLYDGRVLAAQGNVIVVNINYRVGPFGFLFLDHPSIPGNMGLLDQQLGLKWIQENIRAFGGDPTRVTVFGESAGAASVVAHMIAPDSTGLLNNGILESGSLDNSWAMDAPKKAKRKSWQLVKAVGCALTREVTTEVVKCLQRKAAALLSSNIWSIKVEFLEFPLVIVSKDRNFFKKEDAFVALRNGRYNKAVNLIIGLNQDEGNFWNIYYLGPFGEKWNVNDPPKVGEGQFLACIDKAFNRFPYSVRQGIAFNYWDRSCDENKPNHYYMNKVNQMVGDSFFTCDALWLADELSKRNYGKVFIYYFSQRSSTNPWPEWTGVMHGYEIEFVFGVPLRNVSDYTEHERKASRTIIQLWSSFAADGEPSTDALSVRSWPNYVYNKSELWLKLGGKTLLQITEPLKKEECKLWRDARDVEYKLYIVPDMSRSDSLISAATLLVFCLFLNFCFSM